MSKKKDKHLENEKSVYRQEDIEHKVEMALHDKNIKHISSDDAKLVIDTAWDIIYDALVKGYMVKLHGKGQYYLSKRSARVGRNPHTGEEHHIPEREIMAFRVSPAVAKRLRAEREKIKVKS